MGKALIWTAVLDSKWNCMVTRIDGSTGLLTVADTQLETDPILRERVPLAYGAVFGPDMDDVNAWMERCAAAVDAHG